MNENYEGENEDLNEYIILEDRKYVDDFNIKYSCQEETKLEVDDINLRSNKILKSDFDVASLRDDIISLTSS